MVLQILYHHKNNKSEWHSYWGVCSYHNNNDNFVINFFDGNVLVLARRNIKKVFKYD